MSTFVLHILRCTTVRLVEQTTLHCSLVNVTGKQFGSS